MSVGDELLLGQTVDTNSTWIAESLSDLGLRVTRRLSVGDDEEAIEDAVRGALSVAEVVVMTGGLGPTPDDLTRPVVAKVMGASLGLDPGLLGGLENRFKARGFQEIPEGAEVMAMVPEGGAVLSNPHGAAPGLVMEAVGGGVCILLPGVPREMRGIFSQGVGPLLQERFAGRLRPAVHRVIPTFGIPESALMVELKDRLPEDPGGVSLAFLPDQVGVRLRLTIRALQDPTDAQAKLDRFEAALAPVLSRYRFEAESGDLAEAVGEALERGKQTLGIAESCTGGLIAKRISDIPGSSRYFVGGVVAYANRVKEILLGVPASMIEEHGVVSEAVAEAMARGVIEVLGTSAGLGVTGIAGPGGGSEEKPVGTVCYAVCLEGRVISRKELFLGDREAIRARASQATLGLLLRLLEGRAE
ncbi:MAG: CinA family nicotinamide mononucleotide deamidase-related protein [Gemmatimonadota bacterium]